MLANKVIPLMVFTAAFYQTQAISAQVTVLPDAEQTQYIFIENNTDNNYFVTPAGATVPHMAGVKSPGTRGNNGLTLGYIDNGQMTELAANDRLDMWLENSNIQRPLSGFRCVGGAVCGGLPQSIDEKGFYGVTLPASGSRGAQGMMSDSFYYYLAQLPVGDVLRMDINLCSTSQEYDASSGARCKDQALANWSKRSVSHQKMAHLRLKEVNIVSQILINTDGVPVVGQDSADCRNHSLAGRAGIMCKMLSYDLNTNADINNSSIHLYPVINNPLLVSATGANDIKFSLDGNNWKSTSSNGDYFTFNEMKGNQGIYVFFSSHFFKQMLKQGNLRTRDLLHFRIVNNAAAGAGYYDIASGNELTIQPRDFELAITSTDGSANPQRQGNVGVGNPPLVFDYNLITSGMTQADSVKIMVNGPYQQISGIDYCIFSSADNSIQVPFPAQLNVSGTNGTARSFSVGCNSQWFDITDISWGISRAKDNPAIIGTRDSANVSFVIPMDAPASLKTVSGQSWLGAVSASGEIHVQATWNDSY
ncbi:Uncharacterised protein [Yersinia mollaretii]|uniref:hypothetical protein n=1 Tax=Yersinia mollaretii TaxID=33060 RepID=UPI0005E7F350|nr:hypothetical protein [Yersinia mollaretii]CQJ21577.1 Uncharacterised protein [Yersinia mollaretii]